MTSDKIRPNIGDDDVSTVDTNPVSNTYEEDIMACSIRVRALSNIDVLSGQDVLRVYEDMIDPITSQWLIGILDIHKEWKAINEGKSTLPTKYHTKIFRYIDFIAKDVHVLKAVLKRTGRR